MNGKDGLYEGLWDEFDKIYPNGAGSLDSAMESFGIEEVFSLIFTSLESALSEMLSVFFVLFGIAIVTVAISYLSLDEKRSKTVEMASLTVFSLLIFSIIRPIIVSVETSLSSLLDFTSALSPILSSVLLAYGNVNTAAAQALNMNIITSLISFLLKNLLLPVSFAVFSFAMLSSISENESARSAKTLKAVFLTVFGTLSTLLFSSLALQSVLAGSADGLYLRTAKQMLSGIVPVVGSTISASLGSLTGAFTYLKGAMGAMSILFIISLFLPIFFSLLLLRASLSLSRSFMEFASMGGGVRLFSTFLAGVDTLLSIYVLAFLSSGFGLVFFLKGGGAVFG